MNSIGTRAKRRLEPTMEHEMLETRTEQQLYYQTLSLAQRGDRWQLVLNLQTEKNETSLPRLKTSQIVPTGPLG